MTTLVTHYGIHVDADGLAHLMQGRGSTNTSGGKIRPPFKVRLPSGQVHCNFHVHLSAPVPQDYHWAELLALSIDPLFNAMLPIPKRGDGVFFLTEPEGRAKELVTLLVLLSKLSNPIRPVVAPLTLDLKWAPELELENSNVQPLVFHGLRKKDRGAVAEIVERAAASPRTLILVGDPEAVPGHVERIETSLLDCDFNRLVFLPWESLGATVVRRLCEVSWTRSVCTPGRLRDPRPRSFRGRGRGLELGAFSRALSFDLDDRGRDLGVAGSRP